MPGALYSFTHILSIACALAHSLSLFLQLALNRAYLYTHAHTHTNSHTQPKSFCNRAPPTRVLARLRRPLALCAPSPPSPPLSSSLLLSLSPPLHTASILLHRH